MLQAGPSGMRNFIPVRYGTVFLQNPGIPVFFGTVLALYFHLRIFWELFEIFVFLYSLPRIFCHHNKHYHQWGKVTQMQLM